MGTWTNSDGLPIEYGITQATASTGGDPDQAGETRKLTVDIDLTTLTSTSAVVGFIDAHELPEGALIRSVATHVLTAGTSGGSATLDVGVIDASADSSGTADPNGFVAAVAVAAITPAGEEIAGAGALVNTALDAHYRVAANYNTAAFTAGKVRVVFEYMVTLNRENQ